MTEENDFVHSRSVEKIHLELHVGRKFFPERSPLVTVMVTFLAVKNREVGATFYAGTLVVNEIKNVQGREWGYASSDVSRTREQMGQMGVGGLFLCLQTIITMSEVRKAERYSHRNHKLECPVSGIRALFVLGNGSYQIAR